MPLFFKACMASARVLVTWLALKKRFFFKDTVLASMASARVLVAWLAGTASLHGMKALRDGFADMLVRPISFACQVLHKY